MDNRSTGRTTATLKEAVESLRNGRVAFFVVLNKAQADYIVHLAQTLKYLFTYDSRRLCMKFGSSELQFKVASSTNLEWLRGTTVDCFVDHAVWESASLQYIDELRWLLKHKEKGNG